MRWAREPLWKSNTPPSTPTHNERRSNNMSCNGFTNCQRKLCNWERTKRKSTMPPTRHCQLSVWWYQRVAIVIYVSGKHKHLHIFYSLTLTLVVRTTLYGFKGNGRVRAFTRYYRTDCCGAYNLFVVFWFCFFCSSLPTLQINGKIE